MSETKSNLILIITVFLIGMCVTGGTYAYWTWNAQNINVIFNVGSLTKDLEYDEGTSHFLGDFKPSSNYCGGLSNTISFRKLRTAYNAKILATISMQVNRVEAPLNNSDNVYWVLTKSGSSLSSSVCNAGLTGSNVVSYGTFKNVANGSTIVLASDVVVPGNAPSATSEITADQYTIWIWINSSGGDVASFTGKTIDTNISTRFDLVDSEE